MAIILILLLVFTRTIAIHPASRLKRYRFPLMIERGIQPFEPASTEEVPDFDADPETVRDQPVRVSVDLLEDPYQRAFGDILDEILDRPLPFLVTDG
jgi:hypothetical protein